MNDVTRIVALTSLLLSCCAGAGPIHDRSRFRSATLLDDQETGVFTYSHFVTRDVPSDTGWHPLLPGIESRVEIDRQFIALIDPATGDVDVLHGEEGLPLDRGQGYFHIISVRGRKVLLGQSKGRTSQGTMTTGRIVELDLDARSLVDVPVREELAENDLEFKETFYVSEEGHLAVLSYADGQRKKSRDSVPAGHVHLRAPDGTWVLLAETGKFMGQRGGEVYFDVRTESSYAKHAIRLSDGRRRHVHNRELSGLDHRRVGENSRTLALMARGRRTGNESYLEVARKVDGKWLDDRLVPDMSDLE